MVAALQSHCGIHNRTTALDAARPRHTASGRPSNAPWRPHRLGVQVSFRALRGGAGCVPNERDSLCDSPSGCGFFTGPWTVPRSSLRMLRRVATFCRPLRPVLLLVSFPRSRSPVVGVLGLC